MPKSLRSTAARLSIMSTPGCSTSTTRSIRITSTCGSRSMSASAISSPIPQSVEGRGVPDAEGLLPPLRHHHARHDDRARRAIRRLSRLCAPDRSFAAGAQSGAGRGARKTARPQAHPHQRHAEPCRRRHAAARHRSSISRHVFDIVAAELEPKPAAADLSNVPGAARRRCRPRPRCSRISRAISKCRTSSA